MFRNNLVIIIHFINIMIMFFSVSDIEDVRNVHIYSDKSQQGPDVRFILSDLSPVVYASLFHIPPLQHLWYISGPLYQC